MSELAPDSTTTDRPIAPLPLVSIGDICQFGRPISIVHPEPRDGNVSTLELVVIDHLVRQIQPKISFEFGTFDGRTAINIAANAPPDAKVYTIDLSGAQRDRTAMELLPEERHYVRESGRTTRFAGHQDAAKIVQLFGDTARFDFSPWRNAVDFVFIDASHAAGYVTNDTEVALTLVGHRLGLILWHDYAVWQDVTAVLNAYRAKDPRLRGLVHIAGTSLALLRTGA